MVFDFTSSKLDDLTRHHKNHLTVIERPFKNMVENLEYWKSKMRAEQNHQGKVSRKLSTIIFYYSDLIVQKNTMPLIVI